MLLPTLSKLYIIVSGITTMSLKEKEKFQKQLSNDNILF